MCKPWLNHIIYIYGCQSWTLYTVASIYIYTTMLDWQDTLNGLLSIWDQKNSHGLLSIWDKTKTYGLRNAKQTNLYFDDKSLKITCFGFE